MLTRDRDVGRNMSELCEYSGDDRMTEDSQLLLLLLLSSCDRRPHLRRTRRSVARDLMNESRQMRSLTGAHCARDRSSLGRRQLFNGPPAGRHPPGPRCPHVFDAQLKSLKSFFVGRKERRVGSLSAAHNAVLFTSPRDINTILLCVCVCVWM